MPWDEIVGQERAVRILRRVLEGGHVHHAYLLAGPEGVGKELCARLFAQAANCLAPEPSRPCGACAHCASIARGAFADVDWLMPQSERVARGQLGKDDLEGAPSKEIRVDEVRALSRRLALAAAVGRRKIAIVTPADAMNERAQNTLLKTLEEPPKATTFLLVSAQPDALLPTVRSRCARVQLAPLPAATIAQLLARRGAPLEEARGRAEMAEGSLGGALALTTEEMARQEELRRAVSAAVAAPDERAALDLAELIGDREDALRLVLAVRRWTRDSLVASMAGEAATRLGGNFGARQSPGPLFRQAELCGEVIEALEQNGNARLQTERLLLGIRELRGGADA